MIIDTIAGERVPRHRPWPRVIVRGTETNLEAVAARRGLQIVRRLPGAIVLMANSAELNELSTEAGIEHLSGDVRVRTSMSVSNASTGADQTRAGTTGLLRIGGIPGVTGKDIGVAVINATSRKRFSLTSSSKPID